MRSEEFMKGLCPLPHYNADKAKRQYIAKNSDFLIERSGTSA